MDLLCNKYKKLYNRDMIIIDVNKHGIRRETDTEKMKKKNEKRKQWEKSKSEHWKTKKSSKTHSK
jgi:phosphoenolpyruvate-protein kinase (PTS system EI component)